MLEQCVSDIVASTFVHELVNKKADREYLSPSRAMTGRCSLLARSAVRQPSCWSPADVRSSTTAPCSRCRRSPCGSTASGCAARSSGTPGRRFPSADSTTRTMTAFGRSAPSTRDSRARVAAAEVVQPDKSFVSSLPVGLLMPSTYLFSFLQREHISRLTRLVVGHARTLSAFVLVHREWTATV